MIEEQNQLSNLGILMSAEEVAKLLGIKISAAYKIIRTCNERLAAAGKITIRGKVNRKYLMRQLDTSDVI